MVDYLILYLSHHGETQDESPCLIMIRLRCIPKNENNKLPPEKF